MERERSKKTIGQIAFEKFIANRRKATDSTPRSCENVNMPGGIVPAKAPKQNGSAQ
jgi:hypothetical protein